MTEVENSGAGEGGKRPYEVWLVGAANAYILSLIANGRGDARAAAPVVAMGIVMGTRLYI
jgi:hypothetical protein